MKTVSERISDVDDLYGRLISSGKRPLGTMNSLWHQEYWTNRSESSRSWQPVGEMDTTPDAPHRKIALVDGTVLLQKNKTEEEEDSQTSQ